MSKTKLVPSKILFFGSIAFILLTIAFTIFFNTTSFEFASANMREMAPIIATIGVPCAILGLLSYLQLYPKKRSSSDETAIVVATFLVAVVTLFALSIHVLLNMCSTYYSEALYTHCNEADRVVVESGFGCGATDSGPAILRLEEINNYFWLLQSVNPIDSAELKKSTWIPVK